MPHYLEERAINVQFGRASRCDTPNVTLLVNKVGIVSSSYRCPAQFAADRTWGTSKPFSNRSDTALVVPHGHHDGAFLCRQMGIDFWHRSTLQEGVLDLILETALAVLTFRNTLSILPTRL